MWNCVFYMYIDPIRRRLLVGGVLVFLCVSGCVWWVGVGKKRENIFVNFRIHKENLINENFNSNQKRYFRNKI